MTKHQSFPGSGRYFLSIDGLRLIASINIVLFHFENIGGFNDLGGAPAWFFRIIKGPAFHATIFFILGGFIFASKFLPKVDEFKTWPFLRKRFSELYPLHLITTAAMMIIFLVRMPWENLSIVKFIFSGFMHLSLLYSLFPFFSYTFNTPSWAISAFFLCYLLFGLMLKFTARLNERKSTFALLLLCFVPIVLWSFLYGKAGSTVEWYNFFHFFAPIRLFEFAAGMLLARFFMLGKHKRGPLYTGIIYDILIAACTYAIYMINILQAPDGGLLKYLGYHIFLTPFYCFILYLLACERGFISKILSFSVIRNTGRSSFYPYLIHIPMISAITYLCEHFLNYNRLLHSPLNVAIIVIILYGGSYLYVNFVRKRSRPPTKGEAKAMRATIKKQQSEAIPG
ncbi:MAG: acyltransferase [Fibrobacter sp.]|nr:acyltransferase [Fibrobacter sp.]